MSRTRQWTGPSQEAARVLQGFVESRLGFCRQRVAELLIDHSREDANSFLHKEGVIYWLIDLYLIITQ